MFLRLRTGVLASRYYELQGAVLTSRCQQLGVSTTLHRQRDDHFLRPRNRDVRVCLQARENAILREAHILLVRLWKTTTELDQEGTATQASISFRSTELLGVKSSKEKSADFVC